MKVNKTLNRVASILLTVVFLGFVLTAFVVMLVQHGHDIHMAIQMRDSVAASLPENPNALDKLAARIGGFTSEIAEDMWLKTEMGYINSGFQYALGKKMINTGAQNMVTLTTGHLYDLSPYKSLVSGAENIVEIRNTTIKDLPFLFVYEHPTLYGDVRIPEGYDALDHSAEMADEAVAALRAGGIDVIDSRDILPNCGVPLDKLLMVTDQHWTIRASIVMAQQIAEKLNDMAGLTLDPALLDMDNFNTLVHEKLFLGKYGQRVGTAFVQPDDFTEYWPNYDTHIRRVTKRGKNIEEAEGSFREAVSRLDKLEPEAGKTWNTTAYLVYGLTEPYSIFTNEEAPDCTILLLKDSYAAPSGTFLSLLARNVVCVDLRREVPPLQDWIDKYQPDAVVMAYSLQMLRDDNYAFE